jgi:hypothetical protein
MQYDTQDVEVQQGRDKHITEYQTQDEIDPERLFY